MVFPHFSATGICCAVSLVCSVSCVCGACGAQVCITCGVRQLPSGWVIQHVEQFCHRGCPGPASVLVMSSAAGCPLMVRKSV